MVDFKRLGVLGDWEHPYRTMDFANEAGEIRALKRVIERGFVYRGLKPVYWCFDCGSSLAEFEIEYADKKSADGRRRLPVRRARQAGGRLRPGRRSGKDAFAVIWTTTAVDAAGQPGAQPEPGARVRAGRHRARAAGAGARAGRDVPGALRARRRGHRHRRRARGSAASTSTTRWRGVDAGYDRLAPVYLADYATADDGTGIVHSSPAYGVDDFNSCLAHGMTVDEILNPVQGSGVYDARDCRCSAG